MLKVEIVFHEEKEANAFKALSCITGEAMSDIAEKRIKLFTRSVAEMIKEKPSIGIQVKKDHPEAYKQLMEVFE